MCGIAGIINFDGRPVDPAQIQLMNLAQSHRGPDGQGVWVDGAVGFGHRRLAIRDLSEAGAQPVYAPGQKLLLSYNGEIYNDAELKARLGRSGVSFDTSCDTEVIIPAFRAWGLDAPNHFQGMFAFALWDFETEQLILVRDAVGIKPLYYSVEDNSVRFASELKALTALPDHSGKRDLDGLLEFAVQGYTGPNRTLYDNIRQVPPGCSVIVSRGGVKIKRWWKASRTADIKTVSDAAASFAEIWPQVLSDHMISDVPVGLLLSGGVDSSLIAAGMAPGLNTYTASFGETAFDESSAAAITSSKFGHDHTIIPVDGPANDIEARFRKFVHFTDGQLSDASSLAFYSVCKGAGDHGLPVLLTGDGADEFFGGYETYYATKYASYLGSLIPDGVARYLGQTFMSAGARTRNRVGLRQKLGRFFWGLSQSNAGAHASWRRYIFDDRLGNLLGPELSGRLKEISHPSQDYVREFELAGGAAMDRALIADQTYYLPGDMLVKSDRMSMAHSIEVRVPFLDRRVMEFANRLDLDLILPPRGPTKKFLREQLAATGMPDLSKAEKKGFNVPVSSYLRGPLKSLGTQLLWDEIDSLTPMFSPDCIRELWRDHQESRADNGYILWTLLVLATSQNNPVSGGFDA